MSLEPIKGEVSYEVDSKPVMGLVDALRALEKESASLADVLGGVSDSGEKAGKGTEEYGKKTKDAVVATADLQKGAEYLRDALGGLTDLMGQSVNAASEYNTVISQIATLGPEAAAGTAQWRQEILDVSAAMGQDAVGAANAVYDALSSGVPSDNVISFMETASKAAVAGSTDTSTAVSAISATLNAWKLNASEATQISDTFFAGVNVGVFRFEELASSIGQVAPLAASLGVEYDQVTAATATLTKSGLTASQAITQQRASMISLLTPNTQMVGVLDQLAESNADVKRTAEEQGISIGEAALKTLGYQGTLVAVRDAADSAGVGLAQAMGSSEALGAVLGMTGENAAGAAADLDMIRAAGGSTEAAFETMSQTFDFASKQLSAQLNVALVEVGTTIGQMLVPMMARATEILTSLIDGWRNMDEGTRQAIVTIGGLAALIGSGVGIFLSLQAAVAAIGPLLAGATAGMTAFGMATAATGVGALVLAIGALVKASHDMNAQLEAGYEAVQKAGGGFDGYLKATQTAHKEATGLAAVWGVVTQESLRQDLQVKSATEAWMAHSLGVSDAVLSSRSYNEALVPLHQEFRAGAISQEEYRAGLVELADATSRAMGEGRVLTESQREQAEALTASAVAALEKQGATGQAITQDAEWARVQGELAATVAQGQMSLEQYNTTMQAVTQGRMAQIEADRAAAEAAGIAAGKLQEYSAGFTDIIAAGSQWTADEQAMAQAVEASWTTLSQGVAQSLGEQYAARQKYHEDMAAAQAADAEAAAAAQQKAVEAEGGHAQKMVELNARLEDAKTEKQRESAEKAIAKENEKLAGILAATESVGGANVEKVKAQYAEQVAAQQEALAQMVVDHVTNMVLMGQTSEETAKTIFATLRTAYPGVEVFSPVADAHVELMATIRDATDESSATQVESIARLPEAMEGAVTGMEEGAARADAVMDEWATGAEVLAQRQGASSEAMRANDEASAASVDETSGRIAAKQEEMGAVAETRTQRVQSATEEEIAAHAAAAEGVSTSGQSIQDSSEQMTNKLTGDAASVQGATSMISGGYSMAAGEIDQAGARMKSAMSGLGTESTNLAARASAGARAQLESMEAVGAELAKQTSAVSKAAGDTENAGKTQAQAHQTAGRAAAEASDATEEGMGRAREALGETALAAEDTTIATTDLGTALAALPTDVTIPIVLAGIDLALRKASDLLALLLDTQNAWGGAQAAGRGDNPRGGGAAPPSPAPAPAPGPPAPGPRRPGEGFSAQKPGRGQRGLGQGWASFTDVDVPSFEDRLDQIKAALDAFKDQAEGPIWIPIGFSDGEFVNLLAQANVLLAEAGVLSSDLTARLQATLDAFVTGGEEDDGSLAWLFNKWSGADWKVDFAELAKSMNLPVSTIEEFRAHWESLDPEGQMGLWKRLYDDLRKEEKKRHDARMEHLKGEMDKAKEHQKDTGDIENQIDSEDRRHDRIMGQLEERDALLKRQFEDHKAGLKDVADAEKVIEQIERDRAKAVQEYIREQIRLIKERQKADEEFEKTAHSRVMKLLDAERDKLREMYEAQKAAHDEKARLEKEAHDQRLADIATERAAITDYIDAQEAALDQAKRDLDRWVNSQPLGALKDDLKAINDALRSLPTGREGRGGRTRPKPEDMERVNLFAVDKDGARTYQGVLDALQKGVDQGVFTEDQLKRAQIALQTGTLRLDYLRELLTIIQKTAQTDLDNTQTEIDKRKQAYEDRRLNWEEEKAALEAQLKIIDDKKTAEDTRYTTITKGIDAEKKAMEERQKAELALLDQVKKMEEERHAARMRQLEEEYALQLMIAEGIAPEEAARRIAKMRDDMAKALAEADRIFNNLRAAAGMPGAAPGAPGGGSVTLPPGGLPPPGIQPPPPPPGGVSSFGRGEWMGPPELNPNRRGWGSVTPGVTSVGGVADDLAGTTMTLREWATLMNTTARDAEISGRQYNTDIAEGARLFREAAADLAATTGGGEGGDRDLTNYGVINVGDQNASEFAEALAGFLGL